MAEWYISSTAYSAVPVWAASTAYTVGQLMRPLAAFTNATRHVYRCTTAGTTASSEPGSWSSANNGTTTNGTATFTNITGQSTYGWSAAAGYVLSMAARMLAGDTVFISSDHSEIIATGATTYVFNNSTAAFGLVKIISVNKAGSVPPVAADIQNGAVVSTSAGAMTIEAYCDLFWQGFTLSSSSLISFNSTGTKAHYYKNCAIQMTGASSNKIGTSATAKVTLDNTTVQFGAATQGIGCAGSGQSFELHWINTPSAITGSTFPTTLFSTASGGSSQFICRGVDLSAITGTLMSSPASAQGTKLYLDSCKIHPSVTRYGTPAAGAVANDEVDLVNCYDGSAIVNERHTAAGSVTNDTATYMTGGAEDYVGAYSLKLASSSRSDYCTLPLDAFWLDVGNSATGSSKTATVEVISSASLNNTDIKLLLEYMDTAGSSVADFTESLSSVLATSAALPSSSATWASAPTAVIHAWNSADKSSNVTLSGSDLTASASSATNSAVRGGVCAATGKYYFEVTCTGTIANSGIGIATNDANLGTIQTGSGPIAFVNVANGALFVNGVNVGNVLGTALAAGGHINVAVDMTNRKIWIRKNSGGSWNNIGGADPATNTSGVDISSVFSGVAPAYPVTTFGSTGLNNTVNFGATSFNGALPSGFSAWNAIAITPKQSLQATFTPQRAGRVRGLVRLGKTSTTAWIDPRITIA